MPIRNYESEKHSRFIRFVFKNIKHDHSRSTEGEFVVNKIYKIKNIGCKVSYKISVK